MSKKSKIKLKPGASIGQPAAEDDALFLSECFVSHPTVEALKNIGSHQSILLGRTGSGKSAILWHIENTLENVSRINPKDVAFEYIGTSPIIKHVEELGVDLHVLYEYLWTHILTLHFIRECLGVKSQEGLRSVLTSVRNLVWRDAKRELAIKYLEEHAHDFWITAEQVSTEFTNSISERLALEVGLSPDVFKAKIASGDEWKDEQKRLFRYRVQEIVSSLQMRELKEAINALALKIDKMKTYYVLIDDLDSEWAGNEKTQYALIRALIECLKTFRRIRNLKIIVGMREDLYEATLRTTTDKHFQAEKHEGIIKRLRWSDNQLFTLIERRIAQLYHHGYTKQLVQAADVLPQTVAQEPIRTYLLDRTLRRPRDIIAFVNRILIDNGGENLPLSSRCVSKAEPSHSTERKRALEDEWRSCHPLIKSYIQRLQGIAKPTAVSEIDEESLLDIVFEFSEANRRPIDEVERIAKVLLDREKPALYRRLARALTAVLYKTGAIGLKISSGQPYCYCYEQRPSIDDGEITDETRFIVHPMLCSSLAARQTLGQEAA